MSDGECMNCGEIGNWCKCGDTESEKLLDWPRDAAIIVCSIPAKAMTNRMEQVNRGQCFNCGCDIVYDSYTYRRTNRPELTQGRPVKFMCLENCFPKYDYGQVNVSEYHSPEFKKENP